MSKSYYQFKESIRNDDKFQEKEKLLVLRSKVPATPRPDSELRLIGLPTKKSEIVSLLLVMDLVPAEFRVYLELWKDHLVESRKFSLRDRILFRTSGNELFSQYHIREAYGNLKPKAVECLGRLRFIWLARPYTAKRDRIRGYRDQGSKRPDDSPSLEKVRFSKSDSINQQMIEDKDFLAQVLGYGEFEFLKSREPFPIPDSTKEAEEKLASELIDLEDTATCLIEESSTSEKEMIYKIYESGDNPICKLCTLTRSLECYYLKRQRWFGS